LRASALLVVCVLAFGGGCTSTTTDNASPSASAECADANASVDKCDRISADIADHGGDAGICVNVPDPRFDPACHALRTCLRCLGCSNVGVCNAFFDASP
jgi:hypothetical protein